MNKTRKKTLFIALSTLFSMVLVSNSSLNVRAFEDFTNEDGETKYGWYLVANETNSKVWEWDDDGQVSYCYAAEGDTSAQRVYNYAIRNLEIEADDHYSISATFVPDPESDTSVERTYGLVAWYQDADNYLLYWLNQKSNEWSGQLYGRIAGAFRKLWIPQKIGNIPVEDYWRKGEFYDMWWDASDANNSNLVGDRQALLTKTVTLGVESSIDECTVGGEVYTCRKFVLSQTVNGDTFTLPAFYIQQITAETGGFYTGIYSECFSVGIEDFTLEATNTDFAAGVEDTIDNLPSTIANSTQINIVAAARNQYEGLLEFKTEVDPASVEKLEDAEDGIGEYVDGLIDEFDPKKATFKDDVNATYNLFLNLPERYQEKVSKVEELVAAYNKAKTWTGPESDSEEPSVEPSEQPSEQQSVQPSVVPSEQPNVQPSIAPVSEEPKSEQPQENTSKQEENKKKGCKGGLTSSFIVGAMLLGMASLFKQIKKK